MRSLQGVETEGSLEGRDPQGMTRAPQHAAHSGPCPVSSQPRESPRGAQAVPKAASAWLSWSRGELDALMQNPQLPRPGRGGRSSTLKSECRNERHGSSCDIEPRSSEQYLRFCFLHKTSQCPFRHENSCCAKIPRLSRSQAGLP